MSGGKSKNYQYQLVLGGSDRYNLFDVFPGFPLGKSSVLVLAVYEDSTGQKSLDVRVWYWRSSYKPSYPNDWKHGTTTLTLKPTKRGIRVKISPELLTFLSDAFERIRYVNSQSIPDQSGRQDTGSQ
jgi:hypothetical protein